MWWSLWQCIHPPRFTHTYSGPRHLSHLITLAQNQRLCVCDHSRARAGEGPMGRKSLQEEPRCGTSTGRKLGKSVILPEARENSPGGGPARMPSAQSLQPTQNILIVRQWNVERVILSGINNTTKCCTKVEVRFSQKLMQKWSYITAKWVAKITHSKTCGFWNCR